MPERMTEQAYERLYEAINTGRLVAFVGAGLSPTYGSLLWAEFVADMLIRLKMQVKQAKKESPDNIMLKRVMAQLDAIASDQKDSIVVLEFVRQAFLALDEARGDPPHKSFRDALCDMFGGDKVFVARALAPRLRHVNILPPDDDGKQIYESPAKLGGVERDIEVWRTKAGVEAPDGKCRTADILYQLVSRIYSIRNIKDLARNSGSPSLIVLAENLVNVSRRHLRGDALPTDRRSILSLFLAAKIAAGGEVKMADLLGDEPGEPAPPRPLLDPLRSLNENLSIRRFFTTNYDLEIENLFMFDEVRQSLRAPISESEWRGLFAQPDHGTELGGTTLIRHRPDGILVRSDVNDGKHTAPLIEFGLGSSDASILIYHHHGRADRPETLIAADGEYNRMYRAEGLNRVSLDRSYDAMIEGNPILFAGSGLSEEELTRTLRNRVSNHRTPHDTPIFVLRTGEANPQTLMREQINLATKLDVRVIHYGHPRHGAGFSLRDHFILLDFLAEEFLRPPGWAKAGRPRKSPTFTGGSAEKLKWKRLLDEDVSANEWTPFGTLLDLVRGQAPGDVLETIQTRFRLIADLEFDIHVIAWLMSIEGEHLAETVRGKIARTRGQAARAGVDAAHLVLDYLAALGARLRTTALRHEVRQIGREARHFFERKAKRLEPRGVGPFRQVNDPKGGKAQKQEPAKDAELIRWSRHVGTIAVENGAQSDSWDWSREGVRVANGFAALVRQISEPHDQPQRIAIIGERGVGKGRLLKLMQEQLGKSCPERPRLVVNCCYGQEIDSVISLVFRFLANGRENKLPPTRREAILELCNKPSVKNEERPIIVFGAIDRLFAIDDHLLSAEFEWLLHQMLRSEFPADIILTGSSRCERFFKKLEAASRTFETTADSPKDARPPAEAIELFHIAPAWPRNAKDKDRWLGIGYLRRLRQREREIIGGLSWADAQGTRIRMRHDHRRHDELVGSVIDSLDGQVTEGGLPIGQLAIELLKTLALIGHPLEGEVLLAAPGVRREICRIQRRDRVRGGSARVASGRTLDREAFDLLLKALDLLLDRELVSFIEPHGIQDAMPIDKPSSKREQCGAKLSQAAKIIAYRHRFALHRIVTLVMRERFGIPNSERLLSDSFSLTLYAAQTAEAPTFSPQMTGDLEQLLDHLIQSWHDVKLAKPLADRIEKLRDLLLDERVYACNGLAPDLLNRLTRFERAICMLDPLVPSALRAAGALIRGFLTSANLLSFDLQDPGSRTEGLSVLSEHSKRIRLLLDHALEAQASRVPWSRPIQIPDPDGIVARGLSSNPVRSGPKKITLQPPEGLRRHLDRLFRVTVLVSDSNAKKLPIYKGVPRRPTHELDCTPNQSHMWFDKKPAEALQLWDGLLKLVEWHKADPKGAVYLTSRSFLDRMDRRILDKPTSLKDLRKPEVLHTAPFYQEEIVWLLNERAMLALAQGDLYTAGTSFQLAFDANRAHEGERFHPNRCRLIVNRALLWIERGKIVEARRCLEDLISRVGGTDGGSAGELDSTSYEGKLILSLARGYLGLCYQLVGSVSRADSLYRQAIRGVAALGEQRAEAIFEYHRGSLLQTQVDGRDRAAACFIRATSAAAGSTDILYRIRIAQAHNDRLRNTIHAIEARSILDRAIEYGHKLDMHRVRVEALASSVQLRLDQGDVEAAAQDCQRAVSLASQYGMTLRRVWLRVMAGKIFNVRRDYSNARYMFEHAIDAAEHIGFKRAMEDAGRNLLQMAEGRGGSAETYRETGWSGDTISERQ